MKKIIAIVITVVLVVAGILAIAHKKKLSRENGRWHEARATIEDMAEYVESTGAVAPENRIDITPPSSGRIEKMLVEEGTRVKSGQILAEMSSSDRVAILDAARSLSAQEYAHYQKSYKPIKIAAPSAGTIILKDAVNGQTVSGSSVIYALSDNLIVEGNVDESDIGKVKVGQTALINLDAYPETTVEGKIMRIADEGKSSSNVIQYKVKIRLNEIPDFFKSQMTANIKIRLTDARSFLLVPASAVSINPATGKTAVVVSMNKSEPVYKDVETGATTDRGVEIVSGLNEGDTVLYKRMRYVSQSASGDDATNPFMPKRPGSNRKKNSSGGQAKPAGK